MTGRARGARSPPTTAAAGCSSACSACSTAEGLDRDGAAPRRPQAVRLAARRRLAGHRGAARPARHRARAPPCSTSAAASAAPPARSPPATARTVEGIDLTPEFVAVAETLTRLTGVAGVAFRVGERHRPAVRGRPLRPRDAAARRHERRRQAGALRRGGPRAPPRRPLRGLRRDAHRPRRHPLPDALGGHARTSPSSRPPTPTPRLAAAAGLARDRPPVAGRRGHRGARGDGARLGRARHARGPARQHPRRAPGRRRSPRSR